MVINSLTVFKGWSLFLSYCFLAVKLQFIMYDLLHECTLWMTDRQTVLIVVIFLGFCLHIQLVHMLRTLMLCIHFMLFWFHYFFFKFATIQGKKDSKHVLFKIFGGETSNAFGLSTPSHTHTHTHTHTLYMKS